MSDPALEELHTEFTVEFVGEIIYGRVSQLVRHLLARRDPWVYTRSQSRQDGEADAVQDFVLDVLIGERQLDYVFSVARTSADFDRLILYQARRYLARSRTRTVADNLMDRSVALFRERGLAAELPARGEVFGEVSSPTPTGEPDPSAVRRAAALARAVPKVAVGTGDRAPVVYTAEALGEVLGILLRECPEPVSRRDLGAFFEDLLTAWLPSFLDLDEGLAFADPELNPQEETMARDLAERIATGFSQEERTIFAYKYANLPDRELAAKLGISRPTLSGRKKALFGKLEGDLANLGEGIQSAVVEGVARLSASEGGAK